MTDQIKISKYSLENKYSPKDLYPNTAVPDNKRATPLEGGHYTKIGGMWNIKHKIISPKFYELIINTELKFYTTLDLNKFYNNIKMCPNEATRLKEDPLPDQQSTKRHSEFQEYFVPDHDHLSYSWNSQTYNSLGHSLLAELTNYTRVKYSVTPQDYKVVNNHAHEVSGCKIISILLHLQSPHLRGINDDVKSDLSTPSFKNREQLADFPIRILRLQQ